MTYPTEILAANLDHHWLSCFPAAKVLSLDCFDTLLWRKVAEPTDVFYALPTYDLFKTCGMTAASRMKGEMRARRLKGFKTGSTEVSVEEIYQAALPHATQEQICCLAAAEVEREIEYGFIFKPIVDLIAQAKARAMKVVIVSDTYFSQSQLQRLLFTLMPDLADMIDVVFCSSEHGASKAGGIWQFVLPMLKVRPEEICHLGDSLVSDYQSATRYGIPATHFIQNIPVVADMLAERTRVALQLLPEIRQHAPLPCFFHAHLAASRFDGNAAFNMGYAALGPIMYAFSDFIRYEIEQVESTGNRVKVAFLMRDGFLPGKACEALVGKAIGTGLNISRYTSIAASLDSEDAVLQLLDRSLTPDSIPAMMKQMLLPAEEIKRITKALLGSREKVRDFVALILAKGTLSLILQKSHAFRQRLIKHVRAVTGVLPGETLMFVDLGYSGTTQLQLQRILKADMGIHLEGCYLIADEVRPGQHHRKGLIDAASVDARTITTLVKYIAAFEMMCTQPSGSTVDYTADGTPILGKANISAEQKNHVSQLQDGCVAFIKSYRQSSHHYQPKLNRVQLAQSAAIDLARLIYFPEKSEINVLSEFKFDFNLGTELDFGLFDIAKGLTALRREGFGYMNAGLDQLRTNYPMELRHADVALSTVLFAQSRYGFGVVPAKASMRRELVPVLIASPAGHVTNEIEATLTHDGFFSLLIPLSAGFDIAVLLGKRYTWVQIDSIQFAEKKALHRSLDMTPGVEVIFDQLHEKSPGLFHVDDNGMLYLPALKEPTDKYVGRIVFRPITTQVQLN